MAKSAKKEHSKEESFLQRYFGVDRWCTVYEEDEGFKLLADLSLCMYFGCGKSKDTEVPKVVSITNSEDYDCSDTISDICEQRHQSNIESSHNEECSGNAIREKDNAKANTINLKHLIPPPPPPPPLPQSPPPRRVVRRIDNPISDVDSKREESSRISAHYDGRETLDSDTENIPPPKEIRVGRRRKKKHPWQDSSPSMIHHKKSHNMKVEKVTPDERTLLGSSPGFEYPIIVYPNGSKSGRCAYV